MNPIRTMRRFPIPSNGLQEKNRRSLQKVLCVSLSQFICRYHVALLKLCAFIRHYPILFNHAVFVTFPAKYFDGFLFVDCVTSEGEVCGVGGGHGVSIFCRAYVRWWRCTAFLVRCGVVGRSVNGLKGSWLKSKQHLSKPLEE